MLNKTFWLIEDGVFPEYQKELISEIQKQCSGYRLIDRDSYVSPDINKYLPVIYYGSQSLVNSMLRFSVWYNKETFKCSSYYPKYGNKLFNKDYVLVPAGDFERLRYNLEYYFSPHGNGIGPLFIRPNSGFKHFTGGIVKHAETLKQFLAGQVMFDEELILVSSQKDINREWRLLIVDGKVVAGSQYREANEIKIKKGYPKEVVKFAESCMDWTPDSCFILDIVEDAREDLFIMEINSFNTSGLYESELSEVVKAVSKQAIKEIHDA